MLNQTDTSCKLKSVLNENKVRLPKAFTMWFQWRPQLSHTMIIYLLLITLAGSMPHVVANQLRLHPATMATASCETVEAEAAQLKRQVRCTARNAIIDLKPYITNRTDVLHFVPDVAMVSQCGGNCDFGSHRCIPVTKRKKRIPVMMVLAQFPNSIQETICAEIEVEEHVDCGCGCPLRAEDCHRARIGDPTSQHVPEKFFDSASCRCACRNKEARRTCIESNMEWDESLCQCRCPLSRWQHCSTGYIFDYVSTCSCIPTSMTASLGLIAALVVLFLCIVVTSLGFFMMYRKQTGLFKRSRHERIIREAKLLPATAAAIGDPAGKEEALALTSRPQRFKSYDLVQTKETQLSEEMRTTR